MLESDQLAMEFDPGRYPGPAWHAETYTEEILLVEYRRECKPPAGMLATGLFHYALLLAQKNKNLPGVMVGGPSTCAPVLNKGLLINGR